MNNRATVNGSADDVIPIVKLPRKPHRKRTGITPKQVRMAIDELRNGVDPHVKFTGDAADMASQAVAHCRAAMFRAMEILEGKK